MLASQSVNSCHGQADAPLFRADLDLAGGRMSKILRCIEKGAGAKTICVGVEDDGLTIVHVPSAAASHSLTCWSQFSFYALAMRPEILDRDTLPIFEASVVMLIGALMAAEAHSFCSLSIYSNNILRICSSLQGDSKDLRPDAPGVVTRDLPITFVSDRAAVREPTVPHPPLSFHVPAHLRARLSTVDIPQVELNVNASGALMLRLDEALLHVNMKMKVRVLPGCTMSDPLRLLTMRLSRTLLAKALSFVDILPGAKGICALIPERAVVISVGVNPAATTAEDESGLISFYLPLLE